MGGMGNKTGQDNFNSVSWKYIYQSIYGGGCISSTYRESKEQKFKGNFFS